MECPQQEENGTVWAVDRFPSLICPIRLKGGWSSRGEAMVSSSHSLHTHLSLARHLNASIEEFIKIITELSRGCSQLTGLAPGGMDHFPSRLV